MKMLFLNNELMTNSHADTRVAYAIKEESKRNGPRHGQIQQHQSGAVKANSCVTRPMRLKVFIK